MQLAKRSFLLANYCKIPLSQQRHRSVITPVSSKKGTDITKHFDEIQISVPWGHLAGKWYGPKHVRPILGLHGWQDNAGTFDTLVPLLPSHVSFLSLDLPGHGLSSWLPDGISYHSIDYVLLLRRLMEEMKWDKISMLAHSMSGINGFVFSSLFSEKVDLFIGLDILKPLHRKPGYTVDSLKERIEGHIKNEGRARAKTEPPLYDWDELVDRVHIGTEKSVNRDACTYLLKRNIKPSPREPGKYFFSRDNRVKCSFFYSFSHDVVLEMAHRIRCPYLFIKAADAPYYEKKVYNDETLEVLRRNPRFEDRIIEGSHHVHLNNPERVAPLINAFINKYRP